MAIKEIYDEISKSPVILIHKSGTVGRIDGGLLKIFEKLSPLIVKTLELKILFCSLGTAYVVRIDAVKKF